MKAHNNYNPLTDGLDHINIYSKGKTYLGRVLSNFAPTSFKIGDLYFASVESWWYFKKMRNMIDAGATSDIKSHLEIVRHSVGADAKFYFRSIYKRDTSNFNPTPEQVEKIFRIKLKHHPAIVEALKTNNLPFSHYYYMHGQKINADDSLYMADLWDKIRTELKPKKDETELGASVIVNTDNTLHS